MAQPNPHLRKRLPIKPTLKRHPLPAVFGDMSAGELDELKNDIDANGLILDPVSQRVSCERARAGKRQPRVQRACANRYDQIACSPE